MPMKLVPVMEKQPGVCFICGCTPYKGSKPKRAIDLERDYDWGNNAYICSECGHLIATLLGYKDLTTLHKLEAKVESQKEEIKQQKEQLEKQEKQLARIRDGGKAVKEVKAA